MFVRVTAIVFCGWFIGNVWAAEPFLPAMTPVDVINLSSLSEPVLSPDGSALIYTREESGWQLNKRIDQLWIRDSRDKTSRQLTFDLPVKTQVQWSPSSKFVSFLAKSNSPAARRAGNFKSIFVLPMNGGEAFPLVEHGADIRAYLWAPNGLSVYFLADVPEPDELKMRREAKDDMFAFEKDRTTRQIWNLDLVSGELTQFNTGAGQVLEFTLSQDGSLIAFSKAESTMGDSEHAADLWLMSSSGASLRRLTENNFAEEEFSISPDNQSILFISDINAAGEYYYDANLFVLSIATAKWRILADEQRFEVEGAAWSKDGKSIYVQANMGVHSELWRIAAKDGKSKQLTSGIHTIKDWAYHRETGRHLFVLVEPNNPGELASLPERGGNMDRLTAVFASLEKQFQLPQQRLVTYAAADGTRLEGLLSLPLNYEPGQRYPLIVDAHGGPRTSRQYGQLGWRTYVPVLAAHGYMLFAPNYRGGRGYGDEFLRDMVGGMFTHAHTDILDGVDHLVAQGLVDPERLALGGWSAGGHLTNKLITFTDRFKAASSGAGAVEWKSMYAESDIRFSRTPLFGGSPWQQDAPLDVYEAASPLKDLWKVTTPTIIFAGEKDERVPPAQSIMLYRALRDLGVASELYLAPRESHGFKELRHRLFKINAELAWFEKYVNGKDYIAQAAPQ
jgi:dipeptidyl aminopeptidase/acylaminoacyl peptidase